MLKVWRITKWLSALLLLLLLIVVVSVAALLFTNTGLNLALWGAEKAVPQFQYSQAEGALFPRFTLRDVRFNDADLHIDLKADAVTLAVDLNCLTDPRLCINEIAISGLNFVMPELPTSEPASEPSEPLKKVSVPIPIVVGVVKLDDIQLDILQHNIQWQRFETSLSMAGQRLSIGKTRLSDISVELAVDAEVSPQGAELNSTLPDETTGQNSPSPVATSPSGEDEENSVAEQGIVLPEVLIPLFINITRIDIDNFLLKQEQPIVVNHLGFSGQAGEFSVNVDSLELDVPQANATLAGNIILRRDYPLNLKLTLDVKETELAGQSLALSAQGRVSDLILDSQWQGLIDAKLTGRVKPLDPELPFDFVLSNAKAQWPLTGKSDYQVDLKKVTASGSMNDYTVALTGAVDGKPIPAMEIDLNGQGSLEHIDLASLSLKTLGGKLDGTVMVNWASPINWDADVKLSNIQPGLQWPEAEGNVSGRIVTTGSLTEAGGWQAQVPTLDLTGVLREFPLVVKGELSASDHKGTGEIMASTSGLSLAHGPNALFARGELNKQWNMAIDIDFNQLQKTVPDLQGQVSGRLALKGNVKEPDITVDLAASNIDWQQEASLASFRLQGQLKPLPLPFADLRLNARKIAYQGNDVDSVNMKIQWNEQSHDIALDVVSPLLSASLAIAGQLELKPSIIWQGQLTRAHFETEQGPLDLAKATPIVVDVDKQQANVSAHCWWQEQSKLCLEKDIIAGVSGEALVTIRNFNFSQIQAYLPKETQLKGSVDATVWAKWAKWAPEEVPEVKIDVTLPKGKVTQQLENPVDIAWESVALQARLANDTLDASWLIDFTDNGDFSGKARLPNVTAAQQKIDADIELSTFNLDFLQPLLGEYNQLSAIFTSRLKIQGDVLHPQVYGQFKASDLSLRGELSPVEVQSGNLDLSFNGYDANLDAKMMTTDGELNVSGEGNWRDLQAWSSKVRVFAKKLRVTVPPMVKIEIVPDMNIEVNPKLAKITGDIALPWARILVEELPASAISVSKDQVLLKPDLSPIIEERTIPFNIETNINIRIGNDFQLSAFGLKGGLRGGLNVSQKDKGPFVQGEVNIVKGSYRSFGQDLIIEEGKILMTGPIDQPYVSIKAIRNPETTADDVKAGVKVTGLADEPVIEIFSDPVMPQANALSYLLRGQDIDGEAGGNALTTTLIGLSLAKSGKVVGEIGQAFGVQDLQLDTAGSGDDSQVTVSGYVLPGLQVKYGVGIFNSLGEFTVRYRIIEDFYVEAISGLYSTVLFLYQFDMK
ncbi:translocation/assembly module TamB [Vibrio sp. ZSDZ34]|uniref:Translocation/assembly module TamB n=2 Tax=Vibrio gelatinilyticus TaxID=2893468 RepID=A0A9X1WFI5_9VIBR|nr:translocation/assembly module TamB domain-containing protein [Vibrio gelatinilyticus]MCJ2378308.1 translocation/assembly module TamB [Vibrio gelatinilyticus]